MLKRTLIVLTSPLVCAGLLFLLAVKIQRSATDPGAQPLRHTLTGDIRLHEHFHSKYLPRDRNIIVYLPPSYREDQVTHYPVLYMQDGQNLFDSATSFFVGMERHVDEKAQQLISRGAMQPVIIVGIYSTGVTRLEEYTPTKAACTDEGGEADLYGEMLVHEIKPFIDSHYRTLSGPANTGLGGSSLGGLASLYLGLKYADVFGKLAITSPAAFFDSDMIVKYVRSFPSNTHQRISLTVGRGEAAGFVDSTRSLHEALIEKGWKEGRDLEYAEANQHAHNPDAWTQYLDGLLPFLFPPVKSEPRGKLTKTIRPEKFPAS
jgi:predicted alpha/beta superfamily hydrolase